MTEHQKLLEEYAKELYTVRPLVEGWWQNLQALEAGRLGDAQRAEQSLAQRWPGRAASHPLVLGVIRKYWFACHALNQKNFPDDEDEDEDPSEQEHDFDPELIESDGEDDDEDDDDEDGDEDESDSGFVYPHAFIHEWLADDHQDLFDFLSSLSYWPIGLDADGVDT